MQHGLYNFLVKEHNGIEKKQYPEKIEFKRYRYRQLIKRILQIYDRDINANLSLAELILMPDMDDTNITEKEELFDTDLRICDLTLHNFRKFPYRDENTLWGIAGKRKDEAEICSLFLVGDNGTGKTSLYNALEYLFTGHISAMDERKITAQDNYMMHGYGMLESNSRNNVRIAMNCMDGNEYTMKSPLKLPPVNFCSDYDVHIFSENKENQNRYILNYIGYKEIEFLIINLATLIEEGTTDKNNKARIILGRREIIKCLNAMLSLFSENDTWFCNEEELTKTIEELTKMQEELDNINIQEIKNELTLLTKVGLEEFYNRKDKKIDQLINLYGKIRTYIEIKAEKTPSLKQIFDQCLATTATQPQISLEALFIRNYYANMLDNVPKSAEGLSIGISIIQLIKDYAKAGQGITYQSIEQFIREKGAIMQNDSPMLNMNEMRRMYDDIIPYIKLLKQELEKERNRLIDLFYDTSNKIISEIMTYFLEKNEKLSLEKENHTVTYAINVTTEKGNFTTNPKEYFNTFRYKLFVITLKTALTLTFMREHKCLLPIIIDDVFNSSDFKNAQMISSFIRKTYIAYQKTVEKLCNPKTPEEQKKLYKEKQLQIILFTQDELMVHSFKQGYDHFNWIYRKKELPYNIICGRLFNYEEISKDKSFIRTTNHNTSLYNLYKETLNL